MSVEAPRSEPVSGVPDWRPTDVDAQRLGTRSRLWLAAAVEKYQFDELDGLRLLEALRVLTRVEQLEADGPSTALTRESRLFALLWSGLQLER